MAAISSRAAGAPQAIDLREPRGWRTVKNQIVTGLMIASICIVALPLGWVLIAVIARGAPIISWQFLTAPIPPLVLPAGVGGMGPAVLGTLLITGWATLMSVPLGILGAIYLNEYGGRGLIASVLRFLADVMTGVPSIVMGLFVFAIWTLRFGFSGFAGSIALGCLMLPIVIRSSEEMLKLVPNSLREGSYALGSTKTAVTLTVVLPTALAGIISGALLAVARGAGETAPLLFTILIATRANPNVFVGSNTALATQIFANAAQPFPGAQERAWGAALTLIVITFICMIAGRLISWRFARSAG